MALPEWGYSYNALYVPLTSDWQCSLVPARDVEDVDRGWKLSYEERQKARKEREEQIERDCKDFDRLFRVSIDRCAARACSDFSAYTAFIRDHLRIKGPSAPVDGEGVTRILRDAVRDGRLIPAIDRAWRGSRRVGRSYAPQSWPKRAPDPKPTVYGFRNGQLEPLGADGGFIDRTPYVPVAARAAASVSKAASSSGGDYWPGVVEEVAGAMLREDDSAGDSGINLFGDGGGDGSTPLGYAQPFEYTPDTISGDVEELAASTNNPDYAAKMLGYNRKTFGDMVHVMKDDLDLRGDDNVIWHDTGAIEFRKNIIGNMHDYAF
ncbi:conserved hypothetical protein [Paraburkholderia sacchari]|uniref:hypothetical protein n=1 Tax=Paraburkholderia sacchari TaxID=159450 RepID=UPI0039A41AB0